MNPILIAKLLMYGLLGCVSNISGLNTQDFVIMLIPVICIDVLSAIGARK
jgi:hypothetical protein